MRSIRWLKLRLPQDPYWNVVGKSILESGIYTLPPKQKIVILAGKVMSTKMDEQLKNTCLQEISFAVLDSEEKVNINKISHDWNVNIELSTKILEEWTKGHSKEELYREYLIKGVHKSSQVGIISIIPQDKLEEAKKKLDKFTSILYSIQKKFEKNEALNHDLPTINVINLELGSNDREIEVISVPEPREYVEKKPKSIFSIPEKKKEEPVVVVKKEDLSPKEEINSNVKTKSPQKSTEKKSPKKNKQTKPQLGKSSIASFFGTAGKYTKSTEGKSKDIFSKPNDSKSSQSSKSENGNSDNVLKENEVKKETPETSNKKAKISPETLKKEDTVISQGSSKKKDNKKPSPENKTENRKRALSSEDEAIEPSPKSNKKIKKDNKKTQVAKKRSRILQVCDSDSSGEEQVEEKIPEKEKSPEPQKEVKKTKSPDENKDPVKRRIKATRKVSKSYVDEDGYLKTVRETEEYSCSEDEMPSKPVGNKPPASPVKAAKPEDKGKTNSKQANIMNFFKKK